MRSIITALIFTTALSLIGCTKGGTLTRANGDQYTITSTASSKQMVPAIDTTSGGTFTGFYDEQLNILTFTLSWTDLWRTNKDTITSVNFYGPAGAKENGTLVRSLPFVSTNNEANANFGLAGLDGFTMSEKKSFLAGAYYFTINTKKYPNGIIRGQLTATKQ
ncbi:CHRD domain-containing protein [Chitinophaga polysaccharea]|uniref:CHRD domain-containing protein n=1 Tax=Chitinophaga polysaccharea TaxID=1293035 RepID=UPI001455A3B1|nr:CHRD domain-containing protein [Chitinophaga polysaccharea]NLR57416.1 CHRD domain-containing protein [Chitinophaga polysaccharea]